MDQLDNIRASIINEPRGHYDMYGAVLTPAADDADLDVFFLNGQGYSPMCGHAIIAIAKVVIETQAINVVGKVGAAVSGSDVEIPVRMNTPAGRVIAAATYMEAERRVRWVRFSNVPSFVSHPNQRVDVPGLGPIRYDIAWGGAFYALVEASQLKKSDLCGANCRNLVSDAAYIKQAILGSITIRHPTERDMDGLFGVIFIGPATSSNPRSAVLHNHSRNVNIFEDGIVDRSPTGTGISARAALHYSRGELSVGEEITIESIISTEMKVRVTATLPMSDDTGKQLVAVVPEVGGEAFVTGFNTFLFDPEDRDRDGIGAFK
jgi:proline racemase